MPSSLGFSDVISTPGASTLTRGPAAGASPAVLTYIGFDGISTLSEEVHNPRRNILRATVLVCVITGVHMDSKARKSTAFPAEIIARARTLICDYRPE